MRNLTIKREKAYAACLVAMQVYIEDALSTELTIGGVPCRKLGTLKNGEEKTFSIEEYSMKLFVIADILSKESYNEVYTIPAGTESIYLTGRNHMNALAGNPFRFDGVTAEDTLQNRKKTSKKSFAVMIVALIVGLAVGFGITFARVRTVSPETFSADGMQITLTDEFREMEIDNIDLCYSSNTVAVYIVKDSYAEFPILADCPLEDYGMLIIEGNDFIAAEGVQTQDGLTFYEYQYDDTEQDVQYHYFVSLYKTDDAIWMFQFAVLEENWDACYADVLEWAKSVQFTE